MLGQGAKGWAREGGGHGRVGVRQLLGETLGDGGGHGRIMEKGLKPSGKYNTQAAHVE